MNALPQSGQISVAAAVLEVVVGDPLVLRVAVLRAAVDLRVEPLLRAALFTELRRVALFDFGDAITTFRFVSVHSNGTS